MAIRIVLLAWAALFFLIGEARSETTTAALAHLCGRGDLAPLVDAAALRHHVRPLRLALLMWSESHCREDAVNARTGTIGLTQILATGSANPAHLEPDELSAPETNLDLGAAHLARLLRLCGSFGAALAVFHGRRFCSSWRSDRHVLRILSMERALMRWLRTQARVS